MNDACCHIEQNFHFTRDSGIFRPEMKRQLRTHIAGLRGQFQFEKKE